jgi:hypothetical protein
MVLIEITVHPPVKVLGFAYIDNLPVLVKVLVYARTFRNAFQQQGNMIILPLHLFIYFYAE